MDKPVYEEIREWQQLRCTRYVLQLINESINETQDAWAAGQFTGDSNDKTIQLNAGAIGFVRAMEELYDNIENLHGGDEDDNT